MTKKTKKEASSLVRALDFVALAQRATGAPYQTHVALERNTAVAFDGVLAAGHYIDEDLHACPHTLTLQAAFQRCTEGVLSVTQLDSGRLSVKAGKFRSYVQCLPDATLRGVNPDPVVGIANNNLRDALAAVSPVVVENSQRVVMASALIRANTVVGTNGKLLLEYWHGIDMPNLIVPKLFINALLKVEKNIVSFGFSDSSFTLYFEDNSWLRTQLYKERYPNTDEIMSHPHTAVELPADFFKGFDAIYGFIEDNRVRVGDMRIHSHADMNVGAGYHVDDLITSNVTYNAKDLQLLNGIVKTIDFKGHNGVTYFYGENLRGAISQIKE